ncbi:unnamed protein product [Musa acuminata var. zebrina]
MEIFCRRGANPLPGWPIDRYLNYILSPNPLLAGSLDRRFRSVGVDQDRGLGHGERHLPNRVFLIRCLVRFLLFVLLVLDLGSFVSWGWASCVSGGLRSESAKGAVSSTLAFYVAGFRSAFFCFLSFQRLLCLQNSFKQFDKHLKDKLNTWWPIRVSSSTSINLCTRKRRQWWFIIYECEGTLF